MCNSYAPPILDEIERHWRVRIDPALAWSAMVYPRAPGPFLRVAGDGLQLVVGQWALIPFFAKSPKLPYSTNNARSEELARKPSYRDAWKRGQRCIIPAQTFDEPCWESGKNVWWRFRRADGQPWSLAGLWNTWTDQTTGEIVESYTMLTINADAHPLMRRMHKFNPKLPADQQDKRSVIPIERSDEDVWLRGSVVDAKWLLRLSPVDVFDAKPA